MTNDNTSNENFNECPLGLDSFSKEEDPYSISQKNNTLKPKLLRRKSIRPSVSLKKLSLRPCGNGVKPRSKKVPEQYQSLEN